MTSVGLVGLGSMGFGMATSLLRAGFPVHGFDVDAEAVARFEAEGGRGGSLAEVAPSLDALVLVVVNAPQMEAVLFGAGDDAPGAAGRLRRGALVIGCATVPPEAARRFEARLAEHGLAYLDAPISGGAAKAAAGELTVMASGSAAAFAAADPLLDALAATVFRLGDAAGPASAMKIVNQLLAGVHIAAAAEAMTFGMTQGVDPKTCLEVISKCAGSSWMFENRGPHIVEGDYAPRSAVEIFVKDLGIVSDVARAARFSAPLTAAALQQFLAAAGMGLGREDDAAVAKVYARNARLKLPGEEA
ncbi:3-hydroxyisobutyrate dehydrogenase/2-hydroxy-3-oxopropionate reductase [Tistlia consotensis]|uniref:L-threonate dehydrogenase n=1 Tax=Tistlia consotensis USBA 355 TaxID=560819 RepID=A0A1Y6B8N5_9PROT|nr:L-threonate dehydrogenase [Tistlia consotensis]SME97302.1 3-hydroxyisobutyrate dehydrogenase/2-hydroxy-3-oxopropionate reductase [Tistlia consotensis USBA 355]SNR56686.1 3-hydroxyisobutyrate dehydrogenase/2-hydroxy-3-oxopropionate reductase [Tistlia consotensis]